MKRLRALGAGLLIAGSLIPAIALAPPPVLATAAVVDQHSESIPWEWLLSGDYAQTFTVGKTGTLTSVAVWLFSSGHITVDVAIHPLNANGFPTGFPIATGYALAGTTDNFLQFSLPPAAITAGQHLAIVLHVIPNSTYHDCAVRGSNSNPYTRGMAQENKNGAWRGFQFNAVTDFAFRTYVVLPTATPSPLPTLPPMPHLPTATPPTPATTAHQTLAAASSSAASATPIEAPTEAPLAVETPTAVSSSEVAGVLGSAGASASGSAATTTGTSPPAESTGSGGTGDVPLPAILAAIAAFVALVGGLAFLVLRRRRQPEET